MIGSLVATLAGGAAWTAAEYLIHRGLGHEYARHRNFFSVEHVRHHATTSYFAASGKKVALAAVPSAVMGPVAGLALGRARGAAFTLGLMGMYGAYEVLHRRAHTHPPAGRYGRWLRKHHFHHHFHDPKVNHGVTSALWDHVFGTHRVPGVIAVPARQAMPWLVDPATGQVRPEHAADYTLVGKRSAPARVPARTRSAAPPLSSTPAAPAPG